MGITKILSSYIREYENTFMPVQFERPSWDEYFMLQAELAKLRSNCMTRKVGAVIVRDHRQIATGYNGTPPGELQGLYASPRNIPWLTEQRYGGGPYEKLY